MMLASWCRRWMLTTVWMMATTACLRGFEVDAELDLTDNEYVDIDDGFQDLFVNRRSLNMLQSSSLEGNNYHYQLFYTTMPCNNLLLAAKCIYIFQIL